MRHAAQDDMDAMERGGVATRKLKMLDQVIKNFISQRFSIFKQHFAIFSVKFDV